MVKNLLKIAFIAVFVVFYTTSHAAKNDNLFQGYVVTLDNDTIFGQVKYLNPAYNEIKVKFVYDNGKKETFTPNEIVEYAFLANIPDAELGRKTEQWVHYYRKRIEKPTSKTAYQNVFLRCQVNGVVTLYHHYTVEASKINKRKYKHAYYVEKPGVEGFGLQLVTRDNYRDYVRELVSDNEVLYDNLGTAGFGYAYFHHIVELQNAWMDGESIFDEVLTMVNTAEK